MKTDGVVWGNLLVLDLLHISIKKVILPLIEQIFYNFWLVIKFIAVTETANAYGGYMDGAIDAAKRVAEEF
jgi:hypothetical protein